jgi:5'-3' exonuclease
MGIPAYFSFIIKNHSNIIIKLNKKAIKINNLFLDCNSIIYDVVRNIKIIETINQNIYSDIIKNVIRKIEEYIDLITPDNIIYIAFDGVAPVAKLEQQRERRYKSWYQNEITKHIFKNKPIDPFNTTAITPGTVFMEQLNKEIKKYFIDPTKYNVNKIIISASDEFGEGEHKLFEYIRISDDITAESSNIIYGLDADLIMLSINHLPIKQNIFLFRETPEFIKSIDSSLEPDSTYLMDIPQLSKIITLDMNNNVELNTTQQKNRVYDYIFLCFLLGNDFLPHFPALNIRTGGIDKLLNAYKATVGKTDENLTDGKKIYWGNLRLLIDFLVNFEETYFKNEIKLRDKREKIFYPCDTPENQFKKFEALPTYERSVEKNINPFKNGWQNRYYKSLFSENINEDDIKKICINYLEGLEWTMKYYTIGCVDWRWCYQYNYPPLLQDLIKYIPYFDKTFVKTQDKNPVTPLVQLCYVLPRPSLQLLPKNIYEKLINDNEDWYKTDYEFVWAFCKYFWESHVKFPEIKINELESIIKNIST